MEVKTRETENEVTESLDARVFNPALSVLPALPVHSEPSTSSGQPSSSEPSTLKNPQKGWLFPPPAPTKNPEPRIAPAPKPQRAHYLPYKDARTYKLQKFEENRMIIINHDRFFSGPSRPGTVKDEAILRKTFRNFRFKIDPTHKNLDMIPLLETVKNFALRTDFSKYGCICVAILTHGHKVPGFLKAYDQRYSEYEIFKHFDASKNSTLVAKPIIFIIQAIKLFECVGSGHYDEIGFSTLGTACRGRQPASKLSTGAEKSSPQLDYGEDGENYHLPTEADRIVFHSSYVGKASVRHPEDGSWFIQTLCEKINEHASTLDLETIFRLVRKAVALDCVTEKDWKQMPVVTSTTLRELYLAPSLHQEEEEETQPASPKLILCQTKTPDIYPLSHQLAEKLKEHLCLREPTETISVPDSSPALMELHHLPCCCFLEYFNYLKNCLENYSRHNENDLVAKNLLKLVERTGSGSEYNLQKFDYIQSMYEHLETNQNSFPPDGFSFVHRMYIPLEESDAERLEPL